MLHFASFSQFDSAKCRVVLYRCARFYLKLRFTFFPQVLLILECHLQIVYFVSQKTNRTNILRISKLWCARLQTGVEGVKGEEGTFTYSPAFFLSLVFQNPKESFIEYLTATFVFDPCAFLPTGYRKRAGSIFLVRAVTSRSDC